MLKIAYATFRARKSTFLGALIVLLCSSALLSASGVLLESGIRSGTDAYRYAAADAVVTADRSFRPDGGDFTTSAQLPESGLPADLAETFLQIEGVESAVLDHRLPVQVATAGANTQLHATGHTWATASLAPFGLTSGTAPNDDGEVVVTTEAAADLGIKVGETVIVFNRAVPNEFRVSGVAAHRDIDAVNERLVFFHENTAADLASDDASAASIGVIAEEHLDEAILADRLMQSSGEVRAVVATGGELGDLENEAISEGRGLLLTISASFAGFALLISLVMVSGTFAVSLNSRRTEVSVLRAIGATGGQILSMVGFEAVLLAVVASFIGTVPGFLVARMMHQAFVERGVLPEAVDLVTSPAPFFLAILVTALTAYLAAIVAAYRPARSRPAGALRDAAQEPRQRGHWRTTSGLVCLTLGVGSAATPLILPTEVGAAGTSTSALLLAISLALLGPKVLRPVIRVLVHPLRRIRISGFLAAEACEAQVGRISNVLAPLVIAIGFTLTMVHTQEVLAQAVTAQVEDAVTADVIVTDQASGGLDAEIVDHLGALPETGTVTAVQETTILMPFSIFGDPDVSTLQARGVTPKSLSETVDLGVTEGSLERLEGQSIALAQPTADMVRASTDDSVTVVLAGGEPAQLEVVAIYERGLGMGEAYLPSKLLSGHGAAATQALVQPAESSSLKQLRGALSQLSGTYPTLAFGEKSDFAEQARAETTTAAWVNLIGLAVILAVIGVSVINTLVISTLARCREFALLRMIGTSSRHVLGALGWEALVTAVLAAVLGTLIAALPLAVLSLVFLGAPWPAGSPWVYLSVIGIVTVVTMSSMILPGHKVLRKSPVSRMFVGE